MHMRQQNRANIARRHAGRRQVAEQPAVGGRQRSPRPGIDENRGLLRTHKEGVDAYPADGPESVDQYRARPVDVHVLQQFQISVVISVAYSGNDDIADPSVIDAGNLLRRKRTHGRFNSTWKLICFHKCNGGSCRSQRGRHVMTACSEGNKTSRNCRPRPRRTTPTLIRSSAEAEVASRSCCWSRWY